MKAIARQMKPSERHEFFRRMREINPDPRSDLQYASPFELLIAVILSAQATDKSVNLATESCIPSPTRRRPFSRWAKKS